jgi:hypothetical protein
MSGEADRPRRPANVLAPEDRVNHRAKDRENALQIHHSLER